MHVEGILARKGRGVATVAPGASLSEAVELLRVTVARAMTRDVSTCVAADPVEHLMREMTERRFRHLPVVDHEGRLCGLVSIGDVVKHRLGELEAENQALFEYIAHPR
jgi:CBS-domain-containing membrane protein